MEKLYEGKRKVVYSKEEHDTCNKNYKDNNTDCNGL